MHNANEETRREQNSTTAQQNNGLRHIQRVHIHALIQKHYKSIEAKVLNKLHFKRCCIRSHVPTIENCVHSTILFSFNHQAYIYRGRQAQAAHTNNTRTTMHRALRIQNASSRDIMQNIITSYKRQ